jgi:hypothetical protein
MGLTVLVRRPFPQPALRCLTALSRLPGMTADCTTRLLANDDDALSAFHAELAHLMSLSEGAFAVLSPDALMPLVAKVRAAPSEVSPS